MNLRRYFVIAICAAFLAAGCDPRLGHAYPRLDPSCEITIDGAPHLLGEDKCFRAFPMKRFSGIWITDLEYSAFYSDLESIPFGYDPNAVWLELSAMPYTKVRSLPMREEAQIFKVSFLGIDPGRTGLFGHFGMSKRGIFVHHFLKIEEISSRRDEL